MSSTFKRPVFKLVGESPSTNDSNIRSLPDLLEFNSIHNPSHLFCIQALSQQDESKHHLRRITFEEFDTAVHRCCRWIERHVGSISEARNLAENRQPIALFIESNIGLFTFVLALLSLNIPVSSSIRRIDIETLSYVHFKTIELILIMLMDSVCCCPFV